MSDERDQDEADPESEAAGAGASAPAAEAPPAALAAESGSAGGGWRLLAAAVTAPWLLVYGVTGAWAVTKGAQAASAGLRSIDVGYSGSVTPLSVIVVGVLLLAGFAVLLAAAMLSLYDVRGRGRWAALCAVATALTAGSVWAAVSGGLSPALWPLFFGGLLYAAVLSLVRLLRASRVARLSQH